MKGRGLTAPLPVTGKETQSKPVTVFESRKAAFYIPKKSFNASSTTAPIEKTPDRINSGVPLLIFFSCIFPVLFFLDAANR